MGISTHKSRTQFEHKPMTRDIDVLVFKSVFELIKTNLVINVT